MVELEIDNKPITVESGTTIIEAADQLGIYIPRFCYHKKLSIAANCRMCLVEVEKVGKPLPACATPVTQGMKVYTVSKKAVEAQKIVMEFLLINHPLDCPICDQGGECELQDQAMGYGWSHSRYEQSKRAIFKEDMGPLIDPEMTRCIQCTRCVRFGEEIAGMRELGVAFRGENEQIGIYVKSMMQSEVSGNVIDLCPVGALNAKPSRYIGRGWEFREHPVIAAHDCVGSNIFVHSRGQEYSPERVVMRVVPRENNAINETWISDRDRYSYSSLDHPDRILKPRMKRNGQWVEVDWHRALLEIADRTKAIAVEQGADQIAALTSPSATVEECYLLQKWLRALGCHNVDHRIRSQDFSDQDNMPVFPGIGMKIAEMDSLQAVLLVGSHIRYEQPLLGLRLNKAAQDGAKIMAVNPMDYRFTFPLSEKIIADDLIVALAQVAGAVTPSEAAKAIAKKLKEAGKAAIFMGEYALTHPQSAAIRALVRRIAEQSGATVGYLTDGANSAGAWLAGAVPHRGPAGAAVEKAGDHAQAVLSDKPKRAYFLLGIEPEMDCAAPARAMETLRKAGLVVYLTAYATPVMESVADFILPITPVTETIGTFVNGEGVWQSFPAVSVPHGDARPAWKIFRALASLMELPGFDYSDIHAVLIELMEEIDKMSEPSAEKVSTAIPELPPVNESGLKRLAPWLMYRVDAAVRRSQPLQDTMSGALASIGVHSSLAAKLQFTAGERVTARQGASSVTLPLRIDDRLAPQTVFIPSALAETAGFGQAGELITLERGV